MYKAQDLKLKRRVALKFLGADMFPDPNQGERFLREAMAASALDHPNIGAVHTIEESPDGRVFIVMPCYEGETLRKRMDRGRVSHQEAVDITLQTARGLAMAHERGVIHRDIKPSNLILTREGVVKILDFGLAKVQGTSDLTQAGTMVGTAAYMSPEQASAGMLDSRTDIWSLGVVLYEMLSGRVPFKGDTALSLLYCVVHSSAPPLPGVPASLRRMVEKCMAKAREDRYKTAAELANDLQHLGKADLEGAPSLQSTQTMAYVPEPRNNRSGKLVLAGIGVIVLAGLVWLIIYPQSSTTPPAPGQAAATAKIASPSSPAPKEAAPVAETRKPLAAASKTAGHATKEIAAHAAAVSKGSTVYKGPKDGRIVWTGDIDPGQIIDLTSAAASDSVTGALPGVPVKIEVHPTSVHVVTAPDASNNWRKLVVRDDGKRPSAILVNWTVISR